MYEYPIKLTLFHGTSETSANEIIQNKEFQTGVVRDDHWLGQGIYFYRDDYNQADLWAKCKLRYKKETPVVIHATTSIMNSGFLNLDSRNGLEYFKKFILDLEAYAKKKDIKYTVPKENDTKRETRLMCLYCNMIPKQFKIIQRTFDVPSKIFDNVSKLKELSLHLHGTQVCVRDESVMVYEDMGIVPISLPPTALKRGRKKPKKLH